MTRIDFWFDYISPFSYLAQQRLGELPAVVEVRYRPVLFAGLLKHWETKGPAEVAAQRQFTYRFCHWLAARHNIDYRTPPGHPFNPLPALRASIAAGNTRQAVDAIYRHIWADGHFPEGEQWQSLLDSLHIDAAALTSDATKQTLRDNTAAAIELGIFGVPTFSLQNAADETELFWGQDALPMLVDYLLDPALFSRGDYPRIDALPIAQARS
jgi:2-hydroxychromene-2-carboxylate isomerase